MKRIDIKDITFLIPIRLDSIVRLENLILSIDYLYKHFCCNIIVVEASNHDSLIAKRLVSPKATYIHIEDFDNIFYRTKYINYLTQLSETKYIAIWDADIIISKEQIVQALHLLNEGVEVVFPYDGRFYDTSEILREIYINKRDIRIFKRNINKMFLRYGDDAVGGAIFLNKESYLYSGMENIDFYGWGPEDYERYLRWKKLGLKMSRVDGPLFHLSHERGSDSRMRSSIQAMSTNDEIRKLMNMTKEELLLDIENRNERWNELVQDINQSE